jgi:glycosyltransferase involved in cell wall biosynthesis
MNILFLITHPVESASSRYCVYQFLPYLEAAGHRCTVRPFSTKALFRAIQRRGNLLTKIAHTAYCSLRRLTDILDAGRYDLVVIHREAFPFFTPAAETLVFARNRRVVYGFDDAIYAGHGESGQLRYPLLYRLKYGPGFNEVIARSLHVMAGNEVLAAHARQFNDAVSVFPTVVDLDRYTLLPKAQDGDEAVTIGWFGSNSTAPYVAGIEAPLRRLALDNDGRVRFRFYGAPDLKLDLPDFKALPFHLESEIEDLQQIDIGLMPMPDTPWTQGKCAFKAIQYMALGGVAVVSPVGAATELVKDGTNGFHAVNEQQWHSVLNRLVRDPALRRQIGVNARQTIERGYSLQVWGPRFAKLIEDIVSSGKHIPARIWMNECV